MIYIPDDTLERLTAKTASIGDVFVVNMDQSNFHMPIKCKKYSFLKYDSFVDCLMLKTASLEKLAKSKLVGKIEEEDIDLIIGTVISSPKEKTIRLKRFGLI